jgi:transcriptional regulator with XRE-family HTH domain
MTEGDVAGIHGEYRQLNSVEVGVMIRMLREERGIKRAALAADANMSEKTLERAESGQGVSEHSCRRIARALGIREELFTTELYIPTPEEAERRSKQQEGELQATHRAVEIAQLNGARDVLALLKAGAYWADGQHVAEGHLEEFAALQDTWWDWNAVHSEIPASEQVAGARCFLEQVRTFQAKGYVVKTAITRRRYSNGGVPFDLAVLVAFKKPRGAAGTPTQIWLPREMRMRL